MVVSAIAAYPDAVSLCEPFKLVFGLNGLTRSQGDLVCQMNISRGVIKEDGTSVVSLVHGLASKRVRQAAWL